MITAHLMIQDYIRLPWTEIRQRKLRSALTLFGVVIGIAAVVALITLGQGLQNAITTQLATLGSDKLIVSAKGNPLNAGLSIESVKIREEDAEVVEKTTGVEKTTMMIYSSPKIEFNDNVRYYYVMGIPVRNEQREFVEEVHKYHLLKGRALQPGDKYKAVVGYDYLQKELFGKELEAGKKMLIHTKMFTIVGFYDKTGDPVNDKSLVIPLDTYQEMFEKPDEVGLIFAQVQPGEDIMLMEEKITKELRKARQVEEEKEDFAVETPQQLAATFLTILTMVQVVLVGIAAISLFVGGIGIMNTMYTAVLQRTKEIGVMKAIGATNRQIMALFLVESGFYGIMGGVIGVLIGMIVAKATEYVFATLVGSAYLLIEFQWTLLIGVVGFAFILGCVSGYTPARRASKLNAVDSLRYE